MENLQVKFPEETFLSYLHKIGLTSIDELAVHLVIQVFLLIVYDFTIGVISTDQLAIMSGILLDKLKSLNVHDSEINYVLEDASELHFYIRKIQDNICAETFIEDLQRTLRYFETNKHVIMSVIV